MAIAIEKRDQGCAYVFGDIGQIANLEICRDDNIVAMENADRAMGPLTGFISYESGEYTYTLHSPRNVHGVAGTEDMLYHLTAGQAG